MDPVFEEYTLWGILIAHTHTETHVYEPLQTSSQLIFPMEKTTNPFVFFFFLYVQKRRVKTIIWDSFDIWLPHILLKEEYWSAVAERLLLSFKLLHCSFRVTRMLLKSQFWARWWYSSVCVCLCVCVYLADYWCYQPRKAHHTLHDACASSASSPSTGLHC